ncbi:MAG: hypothetical protein AAGC93_11795 [Cyanobacteria bacterium P01_F01_bin.53]
MRIFMHRILLGLARFDEHKVELRQDECACAQAVQSMLMQLMLVQLMLGQSTKSMLTIERLL